LVCNRQAFVIALEPTGRRASATRGGPSGRVVQKNLSPALLGEGAGGGAQKVTGGPPSATTKPTWAHALGGVPPPISSSFVAVGAGASPSRWVGAPLQRVRPAAFGAACTRTSSGHNLATELLKRRGGFEVTSRCSATKSWPHRRSTHVSPGRAGGAAVELLGRIARWTLTGLGRGRELRLGPTGGFVRYAPALEPPSGVTERC